MPWSVIAPKAIAIALARVASVALGSESIRFEAKGAQMRSGYAGKIHIGVMLWMGKDLKTVRGTSSHSRRPSPYCVDQRIK